MSPDHASRKVQKADHEALVLEDDTRERLEFDFVPRFRSALNTPYKLEEKQILKKIVA